MTPLLTAWNTEEKYDPYPCKGKAQADDPQRLRSQVQHGRRCVKHLQCLRKQLENHHADDHDDDGKDGGEPYHVRNPLLIPRAIVIRHNRNQAVCKPQNRQEDK